MSTVIAVGNAATMTSLELVDFINSHRQRQAEVAAQPFPSKGYAKLEHADFMKKAVEVLGANAGNFSGIYRDSRNREQQCYRFPKRESCLMAMSYSYDLQAAVFDHMTALEAKLGDPRYAVPRTRAEALRLAADLEEQNATLQLENHRQAERIDSLEALFTPGITPVDFCKKLNGVNTAKVMAYLLDRNWLYNEAPPERSARWRVASYARDRYLTEKIGREVKTSKSSFIPHTAQLLQAGAIRLYELYLKGDLPMKVDWNGSFTHAKFPGAE